MKAYKVEKEFYHYWMNAYESGWVEEKTRYFLNKEEAEAYAKKDVNKWYNFDRELVPIDKDYKKAIVKIEEIEVE